MTPDQEIKLSEVHAAIVGNKSLGMKGIAKRLEDVESYQEKDKEIKNKVAGMVYIGVPTLSAAFTALWHWILEVFKHA